MKIIFISLLLFQSFLFGKSECKERMRNLGANRYEITTICEKHKYEYLYNTKTEEILNYKLNGKKQKISKIKKIRKK